MDEYIKEFLKSLEEQRKELEEEYKKEKNEELRKSAREIFNLEMALTDAGYTKKEARELIVQLIFANQK